MAHFICSDIFFLLCFHRTFTRLRAEHQPCDFPGEAVVKTCPEPLGCSWGAVHDVFSVIRLLIYRRTVGRVGAETQLLKNGFQCGVEKSDNAGWIVVMWTQTWGRWKKMTSLPAALDVCTLPFLYYCFRVRRRRPVETTEHSIHWAHCHLKAGHMYYIVFN